MTEVPVVRELSVVESTVWKIAIGSVLFFTLLGYQHFKFGLNVPPTTSGDEVDYDSLGWSLSKSGLDFSLDFDDPVFRAPYEEAALNDPLNAASYALPTDRSGTITYRPPAYPFLLSQLNEWFGRQFWAARVVNLLLLAGAGAIVAMWAVERSGKWAIVVFALLFLLDVRMRLYGRAILTEAWSYSMIVFLVEALDRSSLRKQGWKATAVAASGVMGLAIHVRSILVLWVPGVLLCALFCEWQRLGRLSWKKTVTMVASFLLVLTLYLVPWGIRNCVVLERFMPLGTQGTAQLAAGYSDSAWDNAGVWVNLETAGVYEDLRANAKTEIEYELAMADRSKAMAIQWVKENPWKTVALFPMKIYQELLPRTVSDGILVALGICGALWTCRERLTQIMLILLATNAFAIGITWSVEGRFLMPLAFAFQYWSAIFIVELFRKITSTAQKDHVMQLETF